MKNNRPISDYAKLSKLISNDSTEMDFLKKDDLKDIIDMIRSIEKVDTTAVPEEFLFFSDEKYGNTRNDEVTEGNDAKSIILNAKSQSNYFVVPKVIETN